MKRSAKKLSRSKRFLKRMKSRRMWKHGKPKKIWKMNLSIYFVGSVFWDDPALSFHWFHKFPVLNPMVFWCAGQPWFIACVCRHRYFKHKREKKARVFVFWCEKKAITWATQEEKQEKNWRNLGLRKRKKETRNGRRKSLPDLKDNSMDKLISGTGKKQNSF